jgi:hypothetical protein
MHVWQAIDAARERPAAARTDAMTKAIYDHASYPT